MSADTLDAMWVELKLLKSEVEELGKINKHLISKCRSLDNQLSVSTRKSEASMRASVLMYRKAGERCGQIEQHINMKYQDENKLPPDLLEAAEGQEFFEGYEPRLLK